MERRPDAVGDGAEERAALRAAHPGRFGLSAALPPPDLDAAVREAAYALDHLRADGGVVLTNQRGLYLGDPELDWRGVVLFVHPTTPAGAGAEALAFGQPPPPLEDMFDTTRVGWRTCSTAARAPASRTCA